MNLDARQEIRLPSAEKADWHTAARERETDVSSLIRTAMRRELTGGGGGQAPAPSALPGDAAAADSAPAPTATPTPEAQASKAAPFRTFEEIRAERERAAS